MLLTITTTHSPATISGSCCTRTRRRVHERELSFGIARVCYPEATDERCTAALIVDIDPVRLVRGRKAAPSGNGFSLSQYVNDRPYAASSFLSVAINKMFGTAMTGRSKDRPELADEPLPLERPSARACPAAAVETVLRALFEPLGYDGDGDRDPARRRRSRSGATSRYLDVTLAGDGAC